MSEQIPITTDGEIEEFDGDLSIYTFDGLISLRRNLRILYIVLVVFFIHSLVGYLGVGDVLIRDYPKFKESIPTEFSSKLFYLIPVWLCVFIVQPIVVLLSYFRSPIGKFLFIVTSLLNVFFNPLIGILGIWSGINAGKVFFSSNSVSVKRLSIEIQKRKIFKRYG